MIIRPSALKHGISAEDGEQAASWPTWVGPLDEDNPQRMLRLGFDTKGRMLETVVLVWDDGTEELIHVMKIRPQYERLLT